MKYHSKLYFLGFSFVSLGAWILLVLFIDSRLLVQCIAFFQSIAYLLISLIAISKNGIFVSALPYAFISSVWFLYLDLTLGNFLAPSVYAARVGFASTLFLVLTILFVDLLKLPSALPFFKVGYLSSRLKIYPLRYFLFFVPLIIQAILANSIGISQIILLFGGRSSGFTFWGSPLTPFTLSNLLSPLVFIFNFVPSLVARKLFLTRFSLSSLGDFLLFLVPLLSSFASGTRNLFLSSLIPVVLVLFACSGKAFRLFLISSMLFILPPLMQYQVSNRGLINPLTLELNSSRNNIGGSNIVSAHRDNNIDVFASALYSRETSALKNSDYNEILISSLQFVPRFIFPFKPQSIRQDYSTGSMNFDEGYLSRYIPGKRITASLSLTTPGDFFFADGWNGIVIGSALYALLLNLMTGIFSIFYRLLISPESIAVCSFVVFVALLSFRAYGAITVFLTPLVYLMILLVILARLPILRRAALSSRHFRP